VIQKDAGREASIKDAWLSAQPLRALAFAWSRAVATQLPCFQVVAFPVPIRSEHGLAATSPWRPDLAGGYHEGMETDAANTLQRLVGRRISEVRLVHDYLQVVFQDTTLSIYSPTTLSHNGELQPMGLLVGKQLMATTATIIELVMNFGDGLELHVVLDSRTGPEILAVVEPGHPIVVWN